MISAGTSWGQEKQLIRACQVLFGEDHSINRQFLNRLQLKELRSAFRRKALATHPDRSWFNGKGNHPDTIGEFIAASQAYQELIGHIRKRGIPFRPLLNQNG